MRSFDSFVLGARSFLFLTVPPIDRTPLFIEQGANATAQVAASVADYNKQLSQQVAQFKATHKGLGQVIVFDTGAVFNSLLDNASAFGFVNATGYAEPYQNGTPSPTTQIAPYAPVSNYFWLNTLHPLFTIHKYGSHSIRPAVANLFLPSILAHAISTELSGF